MSDNTEQITKVPSIEGRVIEPKREKDPKRVAAGKKLAESNKRMREEHAKYKALEEERRISEAPNESPETTTEYETSNNNSGDLLSQLSLTNVISLVGIGLAVYSIFFKKSGEKHVAQRDESWQEPVHTTFGGGTTNRESPEAKPHGGTRPEPQPKPEVDVRLKPKTKPKPKFGM